MSDTAGKLRSAADHVDDARSDLEFGDLEAPSEPLAENISELEGVMRDMASTIREMAVLAEVEGGGGKIPMSKADRTMKSALECREQSLAGVRTALAALQEVPAAALNQEKYETLREMVDDATALERSLTNEVGQMCKDTD